MPLITAATTGDAATTLGTLPGFVAGVYAASKTVESRSALLSSPIAYAALARERFGSG